MKNEDIAPQYINMDVADDIQNKLELYSMLEKVEDAISNGEEGEDFSEFTESLRLKVDGAVRMPECPK